MGLPYRRSLERYSGQVRSYQKHVLNERISDIAKGIYFVIVHTGNDRQTKKVVIQ